MSEVQRIIDAESAKIEKAADDLKSGDKSEAEALLMGLSALAGTVAALALAVDRGVAAQNQERQP